MLLSFMCYYVIPPSERLRTSSIFTGYAWFPSLNTMFALIVTRQVGIEVESCLAGWYCAGISLLMCAEPMLSKIPFEAKELVAPRASMAS